MTKKQDGSEVTALKKLAPAASEWLDKVQGLIEAEPHIGGTAEHFAEERMLDEAAIELGRLIPLEHHSELGTLLDRARLSLQSSGA